MPTKKKTPTKIPSDLVYVFMESVGNDVEVHTFISKSDPAFKALKKDFKYCENAESMPAVFYPKVHKKERCDYPWREGKIHSLIPKHKNPPKKDLLQVLFTDSETSYSTLISKNDPSFSILKKDKDFYSFNYFEIPIFPKVAIVDPHNRKKNKKIVDYQKFHAQHIADSIKEEQEEKALEEKIRKIDKEFDADPKLHYELLVNHFRVRGIDFYLKEWLMVLNREAYKEWGNPKKMLKNLQSQKSFWE